MTAPRPPALGERALIAALAGRAGRSAALRKGIGDDCALLRVPPGHELAVTTDLFLENTHFRRDWHSPESAGHRCLARGLSDLAAMGARPLAAFLSFALPPELAGLWVVHFLDGLLALARAHGVPLAGGDTAQAPASGGKALFTADIVLLGTLPTAPTNKALLRSGARPGDRLFVTGALGGAAAELASLPGHPRRLRQAAPGHPHLFPIPRIAQGLRLHARAASAIDVSDGLSTDLHHLCAASGVHAIVNAAALPIHALAQFQPDPLALALHGGEDYELLFTAPPEASIPRKIAGVATTEIGAITRRKRGCPPVMLVNVDGSRSPLDNRGWEHFREDACPPLPPVQEAGSKNVSPASPCSSTRVRRSSP